MLVIIVCMWGFEKKAALDLPVLSLTLPSDGLRTSDLYLARFDFLSIISIDPC